MKTRIIFSILSAGALCLGMTSNAGAKPQIDDDEVFPGENQAMKKLDAISPVNDPKGHHPGHGHKPKDKSKQMADNEPVKQPHVKGGHGKGGGGGVAGGIANNAGKALPPGLAKKAARGEMLPPPWRTGVFLPPGQAKKQGLAMNVGNGKQMPPGQAKKMGGGAQGFAGKKHGKGQKNEKEEENEDKDDKKNDN